MKIQNPLISILIINYNNSKLLTRAINSCLNQTYKNIEILIFDDKSVDNSMKIINKYKKYKKIKIFFNKKKKKKFAALNAMNGYTIMFKKSKGSIISLLDSDDYFHKNKIKKILKFFRHKKKVNFIQNLPYLKSENKPKKDSKNNPVSFWPYLAPESCISFRKKFMIDFLRVNKKYINKYENVWMGFRMGVFSFFIQKSFYTLNENLTFYESLGESKKYQFLGKNWFKRRNDSFDYLKKILKGSISLNYNLDYLVTKFLTSFCK